MATLPVGTLYVPLDQPTKHWIQAVLGENPYLPFHYFYDKVTWSYSLLRGFAGNGFLTQKPPADTPMTKIGEPAQGQVPLTAQPVYAFNTDSMAGLAMVNQLLGQDASVARAADAFDSGGLHFFTGAALVDGASVSLDTITADAARWQTPVYGLESYPVAHYALTLPKIGVYTGGTTAPTNPAFHGTGDGQCGSTAYCEVMFDLTAREGIPTSQIGQITSTALAGGVLVSDHYTAFINPSSTITGPGATALQAFVNGGGTYIGALAGGATSLRNAGITTVNTNTVNGLTTPGSTFDATWNTQRPGRLGLRRGRLDLPRDEQQSRLRSDDAGRGDGGCDLRSGGRLRWAARVRQLLRLPGQRERQPAGEAGGDPPTVRRRARDHARVRRVVPRLDDAGGAARSERCPLPDGLRDPANLGVRGEAKAGAARGPEGAAAPGEESAAGEIAAARAGGQARAGLLHEPFEVARRRAPPEGGARR